MPTVLEHAPTVRLSRLTTHFGLMTPLFCAGLACRVGQDCAGSGLCALSCHPARQVKKEVSHEALLKDWQTRAQAVGLDLGSREQARAADKQAPLQPVD